MNYLFFCILVLALFGFLESKRTDKRKPEALPCPSASARARLRANRLETKSYLTSERARCPLPTTSCLITPHNTTSSSVQPQALNATAPWFNSTESSLNSTASSMDSVASTLNSTVSWECIDLQEELTACGTCENDCTSIPNVGRVGCEKGSCKIFTCQRGYSTSEVWDESSGKVVTRCI